LGLSRVCSGCHSKQHFYIVKSVTCGQEKVRRQAHPLRHHHHCEPVQTTRGASNFSCFQRGLQGGCEPLRRGRAAVSVSEWPLVSGRANRADFGSVGIFLAFPTACLATPPKLRALFPSLSSGTETEHAGGVAAGCAGRIARSDGGADLTPIALGDQLFPWIWLSRLGATLLALGPFLRDYAPPTR
jgi:hypothetical protein